MLVAVPWKIKRPKKYRIEDIYVTSSGPFAGCLEAPRRRKILVDLPMLGYIFSNAKLEQSGYVEMVPPNYMLNEILGYMIPNGRVVEIQPSKPFTSVEDLIVSLTTPDRKVMCITSGTIHSPKTKELCSDVMSNLAVLSFMGTRQESEANLWY